MSKEKLEFVEPVDTNTDNEYSREPVPLGARKSCFSLTIVWTGFVFLVTSMMAGGGLAAGLTFNELLLAMILGNIFLCIIAGLGGGKFSQLGMKPLRPSTVVKRIRSVSCTMEP